MAPPAPPPPAVPQGLTRRRAPAGGPRVCLLGGPWAALRGCPCCGDGPFSLRLPAGEATAEAPEAEEPERPRPVTRPSRGLRLRGGGGCAGYVDTHCHLDEVLAIVRRHEVVPTLSKPISAFSEQEVEHWRALGWVKDVPTPSYSSRGPQAGGGWGSRPTRLVVNCNDLRRWGVLSEPERAAALALGFEDTWNSEEMADLGSTVARLFGPSFQGCVVQGCDSFSLEKAAALALAHPKVFASFGCHPKAAYTYDDQMEARILAAFEACGSKAVAWGEFGLDYSHPYFGTLATNRRLQRDVFARQLRLAIAKGLPLVVHSRAADRDTLRMMRMVPRDWKIHIHSFRGSIHVMEALLAEWKYAFIGVSGIITLDDPGARELCRRCPVERMIVETDAPYLPVMNSFFSHPGHIPDIIAEVAELQGRALDECFRVLRENARVMYGF